MQPKKTRVPRHNLLWRGGVLQKNRHPPPLYPTGRQKHVRKMGKLSSSNEHTGSTPKDAQGTREAKKIKKNKGHELCVLQYFLNRNRFLSPNKRLNICDCKHCISNGGALAGARKRYTFHSSKSQVFTPTKRSGVVCNATAMERFFCAVCLSQSRFIEAGAAGAGRPATHAIVVIPQYTFFTCP